MSLIDTQFSRLRAAGRKAFMPFVTAGDPDLDFTAAVIRELTHRIAATARALRAFKRSSADRILEQLQLELQGEV